MNNRPIGVFDSGVGGLTVVKEMLKQLPCEDIVYFGDTARVPYGIKSKETIIRFSIENALFLMKFGVKAIVVACNSSSSSSLNILRKRFNVPVIGVIEPGAKAAIEKTRSGRVGVIGTQATVSSMAYERELRKRSPKVKVFAAACPLFVQLAEEGWTSGKITLDVAKKYMQPLKGKKIDALILGCTHYPLLKDVIKRAIGRGVDLVDSASQLAREVSLLLEGNGLEAARRRKGSVKFYVSDEPKRFIKLGESFLKRKIDSVRRVNDYV